MVCIEFLKFHASTHSLNLGNRTRAEKLPNADGFPLNIGTTKNEDDFSLGCFLPRRFIPSTPNDKELNVSLADYDDANRILDGT